MIEIFLQIRKDCEKLAICLRNWESYSVFTFERRKKNWSENKMTNKLITNDHVYNEWITNQKWKIETCLRKIAKDCEEMRKIAKKCERLKNVDEWLTMMTNDWKRFQMIAKD